MKNNWLIIILFGYWLTPINAASLEVVTDSAKSIRVELDELCKSVNLVFNNVVVSDLFMKVLLKNDYQSLIQMSVKTKQAQLNLFNEQYCLTGSLELISGPIDTNIDFNMYIQYLRTLSLAIKELRNFINVALLERVMRILGATYSFIVSHDFIAKSAWLNDFVDFVLNNKKSTSNPLGFPEGTKLVKNSLDSDDLDVENPVLPIIEPVVMPEKSVGFAGYLATERKIGDRMIYAGKFLATIGKPWEGSVLQRSKNVVGKKQYPDLNKYNQGYEAVPLIILENNYGLFKQFVPGLIQTSLADIPDANIEFFVEISAGSGFYDKGRQYNMIFHGAMADWYNIDMQRGGFDFKTGGFARDIPMGIFDFNGIESSAGDIAKNALSDKDVNAHNYLYSPDNAGFIIQDGRSLVTFWSVAKSTEKRRAVVTFHILFDWNMPNEFKEAVLNISRNGTEVKTLGDLLLSLMGISSLLMNDQDQDAWYQALGFLNRLYSMA